MMKHVVCLQFASTMFANTDFTSPPGVGRQPVVAGLTHRDRQLFTLMAMFNLD